MMNVIDFFDVRQFIIICIKNSLVDVVHVCKPYFLNWSISQRFRYKNKLDFDPRFPSSGFLDYIIIQSLIISKNIILTVI